MTQIPDALIKLRDHKSEIFWKNINENADTLHARTIFKHGFDAACAELLPVIEEMRFQFSEMAKWCVREETDQSKCCHAHQGLAAADKILGEK